MTEKQIEIRLGKILRSNGYLYYKFVSPGNDGVPDRIVIAPDGRVMFVELKADGGTLSEIQKFQIRKMLNTGTRVRVIRGWDEAQQLVEELLAGDMIGDRR